MSKERHLTPVNDGLPRVVRGEVMMYYLFQTAAGERVPHPDTPEDVDDVIRMVRLHTAFKEEQLASLRPAIQECMRSMIEPDQA
jgi:hypothetical protein